MPHTFILRDSGVRDKAIGDATSGGAATTIGRDAACQIILSGDMCERSRPYMTVLDLSRCRSAAA